MHTLIIVGFQMGHVCQRRIFFVLMQPTYPLHVDSDRSCRRQPDLGAVARRGFCLLVAAAVSCYYFPALQCCSTPCLSRSLPASLPPSEDALTEAGLN